MLTVNLVHGNFVWCETRQKPPGQFVMPYRPSQSVTNVKALLRPTFCACKSVFLAKENPPFPGINQSVKPSDHYDQSYSQGNRRAPPIRSWSKRARGETLLSG